MTRNDIIHRINDLISYRTYEINSMVNNVKLIADPLVRMKTARDILRHISTHSSSDSTYVHNEVTTAILDLINDKYKDLYYIADGKPTPGPRPPDDDYYLDLKAYIDNAIDGMLEAVPGANEDDIAILTSDGKLKTIGYSISDLNQSLSDLQTQIDNIISTNIPLSTRGDILGYSDQLVRIPVGTDQQILVADSTQTLGVRWTNVDNVVEDTVTITSTMLANKELLLSHPVKTTDGLDVQIYGGIRQNINVDFIVSNNKILWSSLGMELLLQLNDIVTIRYTTNI